MSQQLQTKIDETQPQNPNSDDDEDEEDSEPEPESEPELSDVESSSSSSDSDSDSDKDSFEPLSYTRPDGTVAQIQPVDDEYDTVNNPEVNIQRFNKVLNSKRLREEQEEEDEDVEYTEDRFDFPPDPENWREEDLKELWADAPIGMTKPGWDPNDVDDEELEVISEEIKEGNDPPIAPFYVPYRKSYPAIPDNHHDISTPKAVIEELDRIEEFLNWVSYIFPDGSSYEGTVWDDLAHGKGVFVGEQGLVRYEGEWLQNNREGHGVVEVEIPKPEPIPGSKLEAKMRAEGQIIERDFMSPEDREWLEKDIEDSVQLADGEYTIPFFENDLWIKEYGQKPEKGRYRYAGQWKQGRMHGCGVYEVNERTIWGRFYFGELLNDSTGCEAEVSALHAGIAEVAAAKARMFVNKPDGMVREYNGPYSDPQHPYLYEEDDVWMAPGFINQFYDVPDYWKRYVHEVDVEREMWLNSFYKAPLRLPMPSELEYLWSKDETPEFVLLNKDPEPDPEDPSKLIYTQDPVILHTPTGRIIDYVDDKEHGIRLFWQPPLDGGKVDPEKLEFLPLGFDEFYGNEEIVPEDNLWGKIVTAVGNVCNPVLDKLDKWKEEKKKASEERMELLKKQIELKEAELTLKEAIEDLDEVLMVLQREEEKNIEQGGTEEDTSLVSEPASQLEKASPEAVGEEEEDEEEEDDEDTAPSSFGSIEGQNSATNDQKGSKFGKSTFAATSLTFSSPNIGSMVPLGLQHSFKKWKEGKLQRKMDPSVISSEFDELAPKRQSMCTVSFPCSVGRNLKLRYARPTTYQVKEQNPRARFKNHSERKGLIESGRDLQYCSILSWHTPMSI